MSECKYKVGDEVKLRKGEKAIIVAINIGFEKPIVIRKACGDVYSRYLNGALCSSGRKDSLDIVGLYEKPKSYADKIADVIYGMGVVKDNHDFCKQEYVALAGLIRKSDIQEK